MNIKFLDKKYALICVILMLFTSFNSLYSLNVNAGPETYENDGIWYDELTDMTGIYASNSIELVNGKIHLEKSFSDGVYDFADGNSYHKAFSSNINPIIIENTILRQGFLLLEDLFEEANYENISYKDGNVSQVESSYFNIPLIGQYMTFTAAQHFSFKIDQDYIDNIELSWMYGPGKTDANLKNINLYTYDYDGYIPRWIKLDSTEYNASIDTNSISLGTGPADSYISSEGYIDFLIVGIPKEKNESCILSTDYVKLTVEGEEGFFEDGYAASTDINKGNTNYNWESLMWEATRPNDFTQVKLQVLDEDGDLISDDYLEDNSKGFTSSPVDLSSIPQSINKIRLNATLDTDDISFSPNLYSWAVTWQTEEGQFEDNFYTELRIQQKNAVDIQNQEITMSNSYGDWPTFGRNSENTRAYDGLGPEEDELYWHTSKTVGGGFRSPVLSEDVVYIASSNDKKIYAFSANVNSADKGEENEFIDESNEGYYVDTSLAVSDGLVIVPTAEINASNQVYAINKSNLQEEVWNYSASTNSICFSAAPTIDQEKVFVTSWNGMLLDTPLVTSLVPMGAENNRIIALNLDDGSEVWSESLPGCSFSSPAVSDGMVFVGCDSMMGDTLFALDQETGGNIWSASLGYVGRASPVVTKDKVFVVVKEIDSLLTLKGNVSLIALDKYTGDILWNKTLAEEVLLWEYLPKSLQLYYPISTSTPAVSENTLYVSAPNSEVYAIDFEGNELWKENIGDTNILSTICNSPVVTQDKVYVAGVNGNIYELDKDDGDKELFYSCRSSGLNVLTNVLASPIIADGLMYVSITDNILALNGYLYSIGDYSKETKKARVVSTPISLPDGMWWDKFYADYENESGSGITFDILDEDYNVLIHDINNSENLSDPSEITTGTIRLSADFYRNESSLNPTLNSWKVTWSADNEPPEFKNNSFVPDPDGWINSNTPECSIIAYDEHPGLNPDSAKYRITYISDEDEEIISDWILADCTGELGSREEETITANLCDFEYADEIKDLKSISIKIADLAGYQITYPTSFKKDSISPISEIKDVESFENYYNEAVVISADAYDDYDPDEDPEMDNVSKVDTVALYYSKDGAEWEIYDSVPSPYSWEFTNMDSGEYEFCTIATDKAGNKEDKELDDEISFIYDETKPDKPTFESEYRSINAPEVSASFKDDYKLEKIQYRLSFHGLDEWTTLKDNVGEETFTETWTINQDDWEYLDADLEYHIYFKVTDAAGNIYETIQTADALTIIKDTTATRQYLDLSDFEEFADDNKFTITADIFDTSDIDKVEVFYRYSEDESNWTQWTQYGDSLSKSPYEWEFVAEEGNGYYQFKTKIKDSAGNVGESDPETVKVDVFPVAAALALIGLAIILVLVTIVILFVIKKRKKL